MAYTKKPISVRVPGTNYFVLREAEGAQKCSQCGKSRNSTFSYDDDCLPFCNIRHWMKYIVLKFGVGGSRLRDENGKRPRGHMGRYLAIVAS